MFIMHCKLINVFKYIYLRANFIKLSNYHKTMNLILFLEQICYSPFSGRRRRTLPGAEWAPHVVKIFKGETLKYIEIYVEFAQKKLIAIWFSPSLTKMLPPPTFASMSRTRKMDAHILFELHKKERGEKRNNNEMNLNMGQTLCRLPETKGKGKEVTTHTRD